MSGAAIGWGYAAVTLLGLMGALSARLTRRLGERRAGAGMLILCALACGVLAAARSAILSVAAIALLRVAFQLFAPLSARMQNDWVTVPDRAAALSVNAVAGDAAAIATSLLLGGLAETDLPSAMGAGAILCAAGLLLFLKSQRA